MMINIEGNPFRSIIGFKDAAGRTHAFLVKDFADASEHVTLEERDREQGTAYATTHKAGIQPYTAIFTGI